MNGNPEQIKKSCIKIIKRCLGVPCPNKFVEVNRRGDEILYSIAGYNTVRYQDPNRGTPCFLTPIFPEEFTGDTYWIALILIFTSSLQPERMRGIRIRVFKGMAYDDEKLLLFRAEWDSPPYLNNHAQPHWHFDYPYLREKPVYPSDIIKDFDEKRNPEDEEILNKDIRLLTKFHFAMASCWHKDIKKQQIDFNKVEAFNWLEGCIIYIKEQLEQI